MFPNKLEIHSHVLMTRYFQRYRASLLCTVTNITRLQSALLNYIFRYWRVRDILYKSFNLYFSNISAHLYPSPISRKHLFCFAVNFIFCVLYANTIDDSQRHAYVELSCTWNTRRKSVLSSIWGPWVLHLWLIHCPVKSDININDNMETYGWGGGAWKAAAAAAAAAAAWCSHAAAAAAAGWGGGGGPWCGWNGGGGGCGCGWNAAWNAEWGWCGGGGGGNRENASWW